MGRRKKTPVKDRSIYVYAPTNEIAEKWKTTAKKKDMSISRFIEEIVEQHLENGISSKKVLEAQIGELQDENRRLRGENVELSRRVTMLETLTEKYELELKKIKNAPFLEDNYEGIRRYETKLIELLKKKKNIKDEEILDLLHIRPEDTTTVKAITRQIDNLFEYGLVKKFKGGLQWQR